MSVQTGKKKRYNPETTVNEHAYLHMPLSDEVHFVAHVALAHHNVA
jgi:hypothetical protein